VSTAPGLAGATVEVQRATGERLAVRGAPGLRGTPAESVREVTVPALPRGPMRLVVHREGGPALVTSWVLID
jgi:hypothetical protein